MRGLYGCTTPMENVLVRLAPAQEWEELLRETGSDLPIWTITLSSQPINLLYYSRYGDIRATALDYSVDMLVVSGIGSRAKLVV